MRGRWLWLALLLSLGLNVGLLVEPMIERARVRARAERTVPLNPPRLARLADRLELEGESRERFLEVQRRFFRAAREARLGLAVKRSELAQAVMSDEPDRERVDRLTAELAAGYGDLDRAFVYNVLESREILDGEQERLFLRLLGRLRHQVTRRATRW